MAGLRDLSSDEQRLLRITGLQDAARWMTKPQGGPAPQTQYAQSAYTMLQEAAKRQAAQRAAAQQQSAWQAYRQGGQARGAIPGGQPAGGTLGPNVQQRGGAVETQPLPPPGEPTPLEMAESSGNPWALNEAADGRKHVGLNQIGPAVLSDYNDATGQELTWLDLLKPEVNREVNGWNQQRIDAEISADPVLSGAIGQEVGGVRVTREGMKKAAHLGGVGGLRAFIESGGREDRTDGPNPGEGTSISDYMRRFEGKALDSPAPQYNAASRTLAQVNPRMQYATRLADAMAASGDIEGAFGVMADAMPGEPENKVLAVGAQLRGPGGELLAANPPKPYEAKSPIGKLVSDYDKGVLSEEQLGVGIAALNKGQSFEVTTADGTTVRYGSGGAGGAPLGRAGRNALDIKEIDASTQLGRLESIETIFDDPKARDTLTLGGRLKTGILEWQDYLSGEVPEEDLEYYQAALDLRSEALDNLNYTIKEITGAAMTAAEAVRIGKTLPNADKDGPVAFERKLKRSIKRVKAAIARYHMWRTQGLPDQDEPRDVGSLYEIERKMDSRKAELAEKVDTGEMSVEEAGAIFSEEFGL